MIYILEPIGPVPIPCPRHVPVQCELAITTASFDGTDHQKIA